MSRSAFIGDIIGAEHGYAIGYFEIGSSSDPTKINVIFNGDIALSVSEDHPDKMQIDEAFLTFPKKYVFNEDTNVAMNEEAENDERREKITIQDTVEGEEIYQMNCAMCHGADFSGGAGPNIMNIASRYSQEEIQAIIENGMGSMPAILIESNEANLLAEWLSE